MNGRSPTFGAVSIEGPRTLLRPAAWDDLELFYKWRSDIAELHLWSMLRRVTSLKEFEPEFDRLLAGNATFVVVLKETGGEAGFVQAYGFNLEQGWASFMMYMDRACRAPGVTLEAGLLLMSYLFDSFPLRKLYAEVFEYNTESERILLRLGFVEEARLREHVWYRDRYWDHLRLALYREKWESQRSRYEEMAGLQSDIDRMAQALASPSPD